MLSPEHLALNREAGISAELIGSGATLLGRANYASTGLFGQAFFNLSIGFERIGKLIYVAGCAIENSGKFPSNAELKHKIGHDLSALLAHADVLSEKLRKGKEYSSRPNTEIHDGIVQTLTEFARNTRYYNLDFVTGGNGAKGAGDPMALWNARVTQPIIAKHCTKAIRERVERNASIIDNAVRDHMFVHYTDEGGSTMDTVFEASKRTGETAVARRWAPVYVLQLARWLSYLIADLSYEGAYKHRIEALLGLDEHFVIFRNEDKFLKSRRTWSIYP
jgi:hypothetical protein